MKRLLAFLLVLTVFLSIQVTAFAARDAGVAVPPNRPGPAAASEDVDGGPLGKYFLYNASDELIDEILSNQVLKISILSASSLNKADGESFLRSYKAAKAVTDKHLRYVQWIDIPKSYKTDDLAYMTYFFDCEGGSVEVTVNGNPMEVKHVSGLRYCAKMTEFGTVAIYNDRW